MHSSPRPSPGAEPRQAPAPGGRGEHSLLLILLAANVAWISLAFSPMIDCDQDAGVYADRMKQAAAASSPAHRRAILRWAAKDNCGACFDGRVCVAVSIYRFLSEIRVLEW